MNANVQAAVESPYVESPYVLRADEGGVITLTLNRGDRFNPFSMAMIEALTNELRAIESEPSARVVVLAASGRGFSAGHDLKEIRAHIGDDAWQRELFDACGEMMLLLTRIPQPVIARVHGIATAAGCQLVSMCDLAVASTEARFALPGVNVGIFCSTPVVGVGRNVLRKQAMEMLLTGEMISADIARERGLVNRVVPAAELDAEIKKLTDQIVARSGAVIGAGKRAFYQQLDLSLADAYALAGESMACNMQFADAAEGMDAFLGKRPAAWQHR